MVWKIFDDMDLVGKCVLVCVDINVLMEDGKVIDIIWIDCIVLIIQDIVKVGGFFIMFVYFGCLKGQYVLDMLLSLLVFYLVEVFGEEVIFIECLSCEMIDELFVMVVVLVENMCFIVMEEVNDLQMVGFFVILGDIYCNDVFFVVYCVYVLIEGVVKFLLNCVGCLM